MYYHNVRIQNVETNSSVWRLTYIKANLIEEFVSEVNGIQIYSHDSNIASRYFHTVDFVSENIHASLNYRKSVLKIMSFSYNYF